MKIYFAGSIRGGRDDADTYLQLITCLQKFGQVLSEHLGDKKLSSYGEFTITSQAIHDRDMDWVRESDVVIAEVSTPSLGVGYEIGRAIELKKKILCLYRPQAGKRLSAMIAGSEAVKNIEYQTLEDAKKAIAAFFDDMRS